MKELDVLADAAAESPFAEARIPRLGILHLMLWTLCTAVSLSLMRAVLALQGDLPDGFAVLQNASSVIQGVFTGAAFAGSIVLVSTRVRYGPPILRQPGHWFLFVSAVMHLLYAPYMIVVLLLRESSFGGNWPMVVYGMMYLFPPIAYSFAACRKSAFRWRMIFGGLAAGSGLQSLLYLAFGLSQTGSRFAMLFTMSAVASLVLAGAVFVVATMDLVAGAKRDWLHWTGVAMHVGGLSVTLLWMVGSWFVRSA